MARDRAAITFVLDIYAPAYNAYANSTLSRLPIIYISLDSFSRLLKQERLGERGTRERETFADEIFSDECDVSADRNFTRSNLYLFVFIYMEYSVEC